MTDRVKSSVDLFVQRLSIIRAMFIVSIASNGPREEIHAEFHSAVGDLLEGVPLDKLNLTYIDRTKVREEIAWLRDK